MPHCIAVDPDDLMARAGRLRRLGGDLEPTAKDAEGLCDDLVAIGSEGYGWIGAEFARSWALALHFLAGSLDEVASQLEAAAVAYRAYEELLVEALGG